MAVVCELDESSGFGIDIWEYRWLGELRSLRNGYLRGLINAFLGPAAPVTLYFFVRTFRHWHLPVQSQAPTPRWQARSAPVRKRRSAICGKDSPKRYAVVNPAIPAPTIQTFARVSSSKLGGFGLSSVCCQNDWVPRGSFIPLPRTQSRLEQLSKIAPTTEESFA